jgi:hypothetical protein
LLHISDNLCILFMGGSDGLSQFNRRGRKVGAKSAENIIEFSGALCVIAPLFPVLADLLDAP